MIASTPTASLREGSVHNPVQKMASSGKSRSSTRTCGMSRSRFNLWAVSWAFMVLFCSYNPLQAVATSLYPPGLGNESLAILYVACAISVFAAPGLTNQLGARATMVLGAACYVVYMISLIWFNDTVVLVLSTVIGFGGAILWIALGVFIAQNSTKKTYGQNTGLFWAVFQLCNIVGNLMTFFVFPHISTSTLFLVFTAVGTAGTAMLLVLRKPVPDTEKEEREEESGEYDEGDKLGDASVNGASSSSSSSDPKPSFRERLRSFWADLKRAAGLILTRDMALLMPMYFFSGLELSVGLKM